MLYNSCYMTVFLMYINDIMDVYTEGADDAKQFNQINGRIGDVHILQSELNSIDRSIKEWSLKLNIGKCRVGSYGRISSIKKYDYCIANEIERTESLKEYGNH